jgi:hypothetical protein
MQKNGVIALAKVFTEGDKILFPPERLGFFVQGMATSTLGIGIIANL